MTTERPQDTNHGQYFSDPVSHFKSIPWCAELLSDKSIIHVAVPDRRMKLDGEYTLVKETLNSAETVRACMTYFRLPKRGRGQLQPGEDKKNPFVEISTLLDLGGGINSYAKTCHGGFIATVFDEVMGTAAWQQSGGMSCSLLLCVEWNADCRHPRQWCIHSRHELEIQKTLIYTNCSTMSRQSGEKRG